MQWWQWVVVGVLLLSAEMFLIDAQFYLVFLGTAAIIVGLLDWFGPNLSGSLQWLLFALLSLLTLFVFRKRAYRYLRTPQDSVPQVLTVGDRVLLPDSLAPGDSCRVDYRGTSWTARNIDRHSLSGEVIIARVEGLTLMVQKASELN